VSKSPPSGPGPRSWGLPRGPDALPAPAVQAAAPWRDPSAV